MGHRCLRTPRRLVLVRKSSIHFHLEEATLWEDDHLLAVNKPAGIATLSERANKETGLLEMVRGFLPEVQVCHRLDKPTTGALLFAKNNEAYRNLTRQFERREVTKIYLALVNGLPAFGTGVAVTAPISHGRNNVNKIDFKAGKAAETRFRMERAFPTVSLVAAKPITGRSHQIRLHAAYTGHPLVGDSLYGGTDLKLSDFKKGYKGDPFDERPLNHGLLLHAHQLTFRHPVTENEILIEAPLAENFEACLKILERWC